MLFVLADQNNVIGVYQAGALSCILYMLFANDLSLHAPDNVTIVQYADDTQLMVTGKKRDLQQLVTRIERALDSVYQWFCHHGMKLNTKKTQMLVLGTPAMLVTFSSFVAFTIFFNLSSKKNKIFIIFITK